MAYVRKTDTLVQDIVNHVRQMSRDAQHPYRTDTLDVGTPEYVAMSQAVVDESWSAAPELQGKVPAEWCTKPQRTDVLVKDAADKLYAKFSIERTETNPVILSPAYSSMYPDVKVRYENLIGTAKTWVDNVNTNTAKCEEIKESFEIVEHQLKGFMKQHASLNAALNEMPELEMYVPNKYMQKYRAASAPRAKVERPTNVEDLNIDVNALASAAITHRILSRTG